MPVQLLLPQRAAAIALFICCGHAAADPSDPKPTPNGIEQAKSSYERGVEAYKEGRFRDAIELFSSADRLAPRAALAFNIARAYDRLNETGPALGFYREYLRRGPEAASRAGVERRIRELAATLAARGVQQLTVLSRPSGAAIHIDERSFGLTPVTLELAPGVHRVSLSRVGYAVVTQNVELSRSDPLLVEIELGGANATPQKAPSAARGAPGTASTAAPPELAKAAASGPPVWPAWAVLGAGGVALASAGVLEALRSDAASDTRSPETSQVRALERADAAETYQTSARVMLGVGSALVVGGAVLWFQLRSKPGARTSASLGCSPFGCSTGVRVIY